jgi:hypothetical protein
MTLLEIVQEFCDRTGLDKPNIVAASSDQQVRQIKALANEIIEDIVTRGNSWPLLQKQALFTSVATTIQGPMSTIAPYGYKYILPETLYNRTERRPVYGPRSAAYWQESIALPETGPFYSYRVWQGQFQMQPLPPVGHQIAFEYASDFAILDDDGVTYKARFTHDNDNFLLPEKILFAGLRWKWKAEKGIRFATEQQFYESVLAQEIGNDGTKGELSMDGAGQSGIRPGIYVSLGNWPVA